MEVQDEVDTSQKAELEIVEFRIGAERYGFESRHVREIYPLKEYCPLPCTPVFVLGLANVRGQLLALLDLSALFGLERQELGSRSQMLILHHGTMEVGILVDRLLEVRHFPRRTLQPVSASLSGLRREFSLGMSIEGALIVDAEKLLTSRQIIVHESVNEPVLENVHETLVAAF